MKTRRPAMEERAARPPNSPKTRRPVRYLSDSARLVETPGGPVSVTVDAKGRQLYAEDPRTGALRRAPAREPERGVRPAFLGPSDPGPRPSVALPAAVLAILAAVALILTLGCATLAPGEDPIVVRTQQTLAVSQVVYDTGLDWCRANVARLSPAALTVVNKVRVKFPDVYRAADSLLDAYKLGKAAAAEIAAKTADVEGLATELSTTVLLAGGPDVKKDALAAREVK